MNATEVHKITKLACESRAHLRSPDGINTYATKKKKKKTKKKAVALRSAYHDTVFLPDTS
jgi:hypothetical protein